VSVIAGGLLQDLEEQLRRNLAPIEERVRPGEETRALAGGAGIGGTTFAPGPTDGWAADGGASPGARLADDPLVIVVPSDPPNRPGDAEPGTPDEDRA
jgi:hypothetical protein